MSKTPTPPIKVRLYGFLNITRRTYYYMLAVTGGLLAAGLGYWALSPKVEFIPPDAPFGTKLILWVWMYLPWLVLIGVLVSSIEVWLVLRKFSSEEAKRRNDG